MEGLKTRLSLLEVLVARLTGGETRGPGLGAGSQAGLQEALTQAMGERSLLQGEKEHLERDVEGLQRRVEEMRRETERLQSRPCYPQPPLLPPSIPLHDSGLRPAGGE